MAKATNIKEIVIKRGNTYRELAFLMKDDANAACGEFSIVFDSLRDKNPDSRDAGMDVALLSLEFMRWFEGNPPSDITFIFNGVKKYKKAASIAYGLLMQLDDEIVDEIKITLNEKTVQFECENVISCAIE